MPNFLKTTQKFGFRPTRNGSESWRVTEVTILPAMNTQTKTVKNLFCFCFSWTFWCPHSDLWKCRKSVCVTDWLLLQNKQTYYYRTNRLNMFLQCPIKSIFHPISAIIFLLLFLVLSSVKRPNSWTISECPNWVFFFKQ